MARSPFQARHQFILWLILPLVMLTDPSWALTVKLPPLHGEYHGIRFSTGPISMTGRSLHIKDLKAVAGHATFTLPRIEVMNKKRTLEIKGTILVAGHPIVKNAKIPWHALLFKDLGWTGRLEAYPEFKQQRFKLVLKWPGPDGLAWKIFAAPVSGPVSWSKGMDLAVEQLEVEAGLEAWGRAWNFKELNGSFNLRINKGQALYSPWFFDFSKQPLKLETKWLYKESTPVITKLRLNWIFEAELDDFFIKKLEKPDNILDFKKIRDQFSWHKVVLKGRLQPLYKHFIQEPYADAEPILNKMDLDGALKILLQMSMATIDASANIKWLKKPFVQDLVVQADIPLLNHECMDGLITWQAISPPSLPEARIKPSRVPLKLCYRSIEAGPLRLRLKAGGEVLAKKIDFDLQSRQVRAYEIGINKLDIQSLFPDLPWEGRLRGSFQEAIYEQGLLKFRGRVEISIGGGKITVSNLWFEPSGTLPRWGADITFSKIELGELTRKTSFGYMTGKIRGSVKDLVMSGMEPEAFDLLIESDPEGKGKRRISAEAVESLSIIGGGAGIPLIGRFFKTYSYDRLGIRCHLENDVFTLRGLIKKGKTEYLVKRGFPFGVDVINRNPEGKISFRDMLDRLKRIGTQEGSEKE